MASTALSKAVVPLVLNNKERRQEIRRIYTVPLRVRKVVRYNYGIKMTAEAQQRGRWL